MEETRCRALAERDERIEELEAELEAEREEAAFFEAERDRLYKVLADMRRTHMELPVGEDGLPIRLGDVVTEDEFRPEGGTVVGMKTYRSIDHWIVNCGAWVDSRKCRHVKTETVDSLLDKMRLELLDIWCHMQDDDMCDAVDAVLAEYAERIREAVDA